MSLYGYQDAISQGSAFNAKVKNFNDGVLAANQKALDDYQTKIKEQPGKISEDALKEKEDSAIYGFTDGKSTVSSLYGLGEAGSEIGKKGFAGYALGAGKDRLNTIGNTVKRGIAGDPKPPPVKGTLTTLDESGKVVTEDLGKAGANVGAAGAGEIESSGLGTKIIKTGLKKVLGGAVSEAGLATMSELGGKVAGDFGGITDMGKGVENLANGKGFFAGETTADKWQEAGAAADLVGTVFPPLEVVGGVASLVGGLMEGYDDIKKDIDKKADDSAKPPPPKDTSVKVSPAFSQMGLVASAPISAKASITGA